MSQKKTNSASLERLSSKSVLIVADPYLPVPPLTYGGVERIVDILATGLSDRGWNVTLVCHPDSKCPAHKIHIPELKSEKLGRIRNASKILSHTLSNRYDIVHSFAHVDLTALIWPLKHKVIHTFQAFPDWQAFSKRIRIIPRKNLWFTTVGRHMVSTFEHIAPTLCIHNCVRMDQFTFRASVPSDAPLVFLGRIEPIKGTHLAIDIAKATNRKLIIAGNRSENAEIDRYFLERIEPQLSDQISYKGPVNDIQKNKLLGEAAAFLMPIEWDEPFGIVMAEALACGTPVIGTARGALPEIVTNGLTGQACSNVDEMINAVRNLDSFSREACRKSAEQSFSSEFIVDHYVQLYDKILEMNE
jgi:glycosyltransferase involved in cell wall biosynthesis